MIRRLATADPPSRARGNRPRKGHVYTTMRRMLTLGFFVAIYCARAFYPAVLTYTFTRREHATTTVSECTQGRIRHGTGTGTWRTEDGQRGEGEIYGLDHEQAVLEIGDESVPVRIGPLGPYANGWGGSWSYFLTLVPLLLFTFLFFWIRHRIILPGRRLAESLLTASDDVLVISERDGVTPEVRGGAGTPAATAAKFRRRRVLRIEQGTPPHLRQAATAPVLAKLLSVD